MKAVLFVLLAGMAVASAQEFIAPTAPRREIVPEVSEPRPSIEGIVREVFEKRRPWQMVNPLAPASYGSGQRFVSRDFGPGTPYHSSGVVVAGFEW
ncbi:MAG: hypothetical protein SFU53_01190 [Terrimicrobiaceae bacterium]|nr:hypothetical protein [Terrimicrobiaceae bacterium]